MSRFSSRLKPAIIAAISALLLFPTAVLADFSDVPVSHQNYDAIRTLEDQGIIRGYPDGTFQPEKTVTRAELLKMTFRHIGFEPEERLYETKFKDVPDGSWFAPYVRKGYELGVVSINPDIPLFYPDAPITKIEALKLVMPLEGIPAPYLTDETPIIFDDVSKDAPHAYLVRAAQKSGIYSLSDGRYFRPFQNLTRGETAELLYRAQIYRETRGDTTVIIGPELFELTDYFTETESRLINNPKFPILLNVWTKINQQYVGKKDLDQNKLVYGAIGGMVDTLEDPYSIFESPESAEDIQRELEGTYVGIGTILDVFDNNFIIVAVLKDSPAELAGLLPGDIIKKVDGRDLTGLAVDEVISLIKGPDGTEVTLTIRRDSNTMTFTITRSEISLDSVLVELPSAETIIPSDIGYIAIYQFTSTTGGEFDDVFQEALAKKPIGMILDLRDNPGGYLSSAYEVLGHFIPAGKNIMNIQISDSIMAQESEGDGEFAESDIPLIVLVNDNSASAAEVVAGALQDYNIGTLIGEQTYGKGTVQEVTTYTDGSFFKLSIAHWLTPLQRNIDQIGLTPDIPVARTKDDVLNKTDSQLERAIAELNSK